MTAFDAPNTHLLDRLVQAVPPGEQQPVHLLRVVQKAWGAREKESEERVNILKAPRRLKLRARAAANHVSPRLAALVAPDEEQRGAQDLEAWE